MSNENCIQSMCSDPVFVGKVNGIDAVVFVTVIVPNVGVPGATAGIVK